MKNGEIKLGACSKGNDKIASYHEGDIIIINETNKLEYTISANSNMTILLMCKQGKTQIYIDNKMVIMESSDLLFIPPNTNITNWMFSSDVDCSAICLRTMKVHDFLRTQDLLNLLFTIRKHPLLHINENQFHNLIRLKEYITQMFSSTHPYYEKIMSHFVEIILYDILGAYKEVMEEIVSADTDIPTRSNQLFTAFINLLHNAKGIHREVNFYADKLYVTPKYLSHLCKSISGRTCSQWITETVVEEIRHLLCYTDLSIKEIADKLLFNNYSFFSKYVREKLECTPMEYRERFRVGNQ
ncbi:MAG: helix-turn-helix domain-containing protein [Prevotellaceae bacterium]|nr:helix-turn-helix domain-containing protein [Prevotellaceae bacterium]